MCVYIATFPMIFQIRSQLNPYYSHCPLAPHGYITTFPIIDLGNYSISQPEMRRILGMIPSTTNHYSSQVAVRSL